MLNEYQNLVPSEKEMKLRVFINQLTNDLYNNEKIEIDSRNLLELLSYLTSNENISTQMKSALEYQNSRITDILHKKEVDHLKEYIKYLEEHSIPVQKVNDEIEKYEYMLAETIHGEIQRYTPGEILLKIDTLKEILEDK